VAALIIVPLVAEIGSKMEDPHPNLLIMGAALLCSCAMGLPTSGFPNVTAISLVDDFGERYLTVGSFILGGVPSSIFAYLVVVTVGYVLMRILGL
jgi:phosphate transporter